MEVFTWNQITDKDYPFFNRGSALTVGSFDGPHRGHELLFQEVLNAGKIRNLLTGVITFKRPLPSIKHSSSYLGDIASLEERLEQYNKRGFDFAIVIDFSDRFGRIEGRDFLTVLKTKCKMKFMAEGTDFHFGYKGACGIEFIKSFALCNDITVSPLELVKLNSERISSSSVREAIHDSNFQLAQEMMGHPYILDLSDVPFIKSNNTYIYKRSCILQVLPNNGMYNVFVNTSELRSRLEVSSDSILVELAGNEIARIQSIKFI